MESETNQKWIIARFDNADSPIAKALYWSITDGWGGIERITIYTCKEKNIHPLPPMAIWEKYP